MYYIRLLRPPELTGSKIKLLVTVTTDLGDSFCPFPHTLHASIHSHGSELGTSSAQWQASSRTIWLSIDELLPGVQTDVFTVHVTSLDRSLMRKESVLDVWWSSDSKHHVERRLMLRSGPLCVREELGESIARHIWDAAIGLVSHLEGTEPSSLTQMIMRRLQAKRRSRVVELGAGCGLVSMYLASRCPGLNILATDLPEAMEILQVNRGRAESGRSINAVVFDWQAEMPDALTAAVDLLVISDCTYNCDSIPALVKSLCRLSAAAAVPPLILVALKRRHPSEAVFFDLMRDACLGQLAHEEVAGDIHLYVYARHCLPS